jgi:cell division protein FtsW (lipid II flippase)
MLGRFFVFVATALLGSLFIEVAIYHPGIAMQRDAVAIVPGVVAALAICAGFLFLARANRYTVALFVLACCCAIVVGLLGTAIHLAIHAGSIARLATDPQAWFGDPPTLAPLSFAVGGCLGLVPLAWQTEIAPCTPAASRLLELTAAVAGLVAVIAATQPDWSTLSLITVLCGLAFGVLGYGIEWVRVIVRAYVPGRV